MYKEILDSFDLKNIPNLDVAVLGALELFSKTTLPKIPKINEKTLLIGSEGALYTGKIVFADSPVIFGNQNNFQQILNQNPEIKQVIILSASGGKDAGQISKKLTNKNPSITLLTNTSNSKAEKYATKTLVFPKNREPYTYNTSTYLAMIMAKTGESPEKIKDFLEKDFIGKINTDLKQFDSFFFILPDKFADFKNLINIKFEEIFGSFISSRAHSASSTKHAKLVIPNEKELIINFASQNQNIGNNFNVLNFALPENMDSGLMFSIIYFLIGKIQEINPPYFKENLENYVKIASLNFGEEISPIVK